MLTQKVFIHTFVDKLPEFYVFGIMSIKMIPAILESWTLTKSSRGNDCCVLVRAGARNHGGQSLASFSPFIDGLIASDTLRFVMKCFIVIAIQMIAYEQIKFSNVDKCPIKLRTAGAKCTTEPGLICLFEGGAKVYRSC